MFFASPTTSNEEKSGANRLTAETVDGLEKAG